jgi:hypothetical protein
MSKGVLSKGTMGKGTTRSRIQTMIRIAVVLVGAGLVMAPTVTGAVAFAQAPAPAVTAEQKQSRYQIGQMERVLEGAVEHGVTNIRDRLQSLGPTELLITDNARARGFRLDGYGVFFDVVAPSFGTTVLWSMRTLDQNNLGLESALKVLQAHVKDAGDVNLEQALRRVELQMNPMLVTRTSGGSAAAGPTAAAGPARAGGGEPAVDAILTDPNEAYRSEVTTALMAAMLDYSSSIDIQPGEWLTVAVRRNDERPRLAPADSDARTFVLRLRGSDRAAFLARQISRDEAMTRIEVRVF